MYALTYLSERGGGGGVGVKNPGIKVVVQYYRVKHRGRRSTIEVTRSDGLYIERRPRCPDFWHRSPLIHIFPFNTRPSWTFTCRYSFDYGMVHFIMMSTEHDFSPESQQYLWLEKDLQSVDRSKTPWVIIGGHRAMYCSALLPGKVHNQTPLIVLIKASMNKLFLEWNASYFDCQVLPCIATHCCQLTSHQTALIVAIGHQHSVWWYFLWTF